ncbi:MAG: sel1 repeat family protein [Alphaproteobacteria bacterium]|nr:sel1 repeat family protein [Alphaproteobacteria bacterium]
MNFSGILFFFLICLSGSAIAQTVDRDSFEVGVEAFNAGNCEEALRIMKQYEKEQPSAAYVVNACSLMLSSEKKEGKISYDIFLRDLNKGDLSKFDQLGMIVRFKEEISGISGAQYVNALIANAKRNDTAALFQLGLLFQEGIGAEQNFKQAAFYFEAAAKNGHTDAMNSIGLYNRFGIGVEENKEKAEEWWQKALLNKNAYAPYNLGQMYMEDKNFLRAWLLADLAVKRISPGKEKKYHLRAQSLLKKAQKQLSVFHSAYLKKFRPFWLKPALSPDETKDFVITQNLPEPPEKMIEETSFLRFIRKDAFDNKYKTFFPLMPSWVSFDPDSPVNPDLTGKTPPAPFPQDKEVISALYFRPSDPRYVNLTLSARESAIPVMIGDVLTLSVYTPLHETTTTKKGGHMYLKNTGYKIIVQDPANIITGDTGVVLTPLSPQTARKEAWLSRSFVIRGEGSALIKFVPQKVPDGKTVFPHTARIVSFKGKPPK